MTYVCNEDYQECWKCPRNDCMIKVFNKSVVKIKRRKDIEEQLKRELK